MFLLLSLRPLTPFVLVCWLTLCHNSFVDRHSRRSALKINILHALQNAAFPTIFVLVPFPLKTTVAAVQ